MDWYAIEAKNGLGNRQGRHKTRRRRAGCRDGRVGCRIRQPAWPYRWAKGTSPVPLAPQFFARSCHGIDVNGLVGGHILARRPSASAYGQHRASDPGGLGQYVSLQQVVSKIRPPLTHIPPPVIELHAQFLELNFLSQVRALPNPAYISSSTDGPKLAPHPLTLHLSPTSTVNVAVTGLSPPPAASAAFAKIAPDAEVHVAPKTRQKERGSGREARSVTSTGRRSAGAKSGASTVRRAGKEEASSRGAVFLRAIDRALSTDWFDDEISDEEADGQEAKDDGDISALADKGLQVWVDPTVLATKALKGVTWVAVSIVKPAGLQPPAPVESQSEPEQKAAVKIVAKLRTWADAHAARRQDIE